VLNASVVARAGATAAGNASSGPDTPPGGGGVVGSPIRGRDDRSVLVVWWLVSILGLAVVVPLITSLFANTTLPPNARTGNVVDFFGRRFRRDRRPK
jgi:hypothetical protein